MAENMFSSEHKANSKKFRDNYDKIFRKDKKEVNKKSFKSEIGDLPDKE